jgi:hypothetical protein
MSQLEFNFYRNAIPSLVERVRERCYEITSLPSPLSTGERGLITLTVSLWGLNWNHLYRNAIPSLVERVRERCCFFTSLPSPLSTGERGLITFTVSLGV